MIDNALPAVGDANTMGGAYPLYPNIAYPYLQTNTSIQPITLKKVI